MNDLCPCGSTRNFDVCCEPYIAGRALPPTPEALMRSRYTAYAKVKTAYLRETLAPETRGDFNEAEVRRWAESSEWLGLEIHRASGDLVEFSAHYSTDGKKIEHRETSRFVQVANRWYFLSGESEVAEEGDETARDLKPIKRLEPKIGRNDPCTCGSGKKAKKCCHTAA